MRQHVEQAIREVSAARFYQEHAYITAIATRLVGTAYSGTLGEVSFDATIVADRGPGIAESWSGADLALTARIRNGGSDIRKAILAQAKMGSVAELNTGELHDLFEQIEKMKQLTPSPKVIEIVEANGVRIPRVISGKLLSENQHYTPLGLADYIVRRVLPTLDGDTRPRFVDAVQDSHLPELRIIATLR